MEHYLNWSGCKCRIFNVGKYRRQAYADYMAEKHQHQSETSNTSAERLNGTSSHGGLDNNTASRESHGACDASFFDANNVEAAQLRERVASTALQDMLQWLDDEDGLGNSYDGSEVSVELSRHSTISNLGMPKLSFANNERVAIFDATNSTRKRRQWVLEECTSPLKRPGKPTGVVFGTCGYR
jgi:hypothetical protein